MESYVIYNAEYQALICRKHQYAIPPKSIERHFREEHKEIPLQSRQKILRQSEVLTLCEPDEIIEPRGKVAPIDGLNIQSGFLCKFDSCMIISGTLNTIKEHVKRHKWNVDSGHKWELIKVQTFFQKNNRRY